MLLLPKFHMAAAALWVFGGAVVEMTQTAGAATREECTCTLEGRYDPTGAQVVNAGVCERDQIGQWCDIYLVATENSNRHQSILLTFDRAAEAGDPEEFSDVLQGLLKEYVNSREGKPGYDRARANEDQLSASIYRLAPEIQSCVSAFLVTEQSSVQADGFMCSVGPESGWLNISFEVNEGIFSFLFAPGR